MRAMNDAGPSMVPHTTAAMSESPALGALERGARTRSLGGDFASHDESVARSAWDMLNDIPAAGRTEAGDTLRSGFMRNGVAQTPRVFGKGADQVPEVTSHRLRKALGQLSPHLSETEKDTFFKLSDDLMQGDNIKFGVGATAPDTSNPHALAASIGLAAGSAHFSSPKLWKIRSIFNQLTGNSRDKVTRGVDEALLDPDKFMNMVDRIRTKVGTDLPLTEGEQMLKFAIEKAATFGGRAVAAPTTPYKPDKGY